MEIQVRYFAVLRERLGREDESLTLPDGATVSDAVDLLATIHPVVGALRGRFQTAVNQEMVPPDHVLGDGDELVLIPPVAGGADPAGGGKDAAPAPPRHARVLAEPLSLDRTVAAVAGPEMGGLVTFTGVVRRVSQGRAVEHLEYEAYRDMAEKVMARLCDEIEREIAGARLAVEHRVGTLAVGEAAVVIAAAAPHRAEAFAACRALIDRLKQRAPIWKREVGPDGAEWVGLGP